MHKIAGFLAASLLFSASVSAMPAKPADVVQHFVQSTALAELLTDHHSYTGVTIEVVRNLSDAVEALCNQKSRSRSIVAVSLLRGDDISVYYFQTPSDPRDLKRCLPGGPSEL